MVFDELREKIENGTSIGNIFNLFATFTQNTSGENYR